MKINGIEMTGAIFDVDGTLLDSMPIWEHVAEEYLLSQGRKPKENLYETFKTMSLMESATYFIERYHIQKSVKQIIDEIDQRIQYAYEKTIPLKNGVSGMLETFYESHIPMCIATATEKPLIKAALKRTNIATYFTELITCTEVGASKEYPNIYKEAQKRMKTSLQTTIVFEDAYHAIKTAKQAGYPVIAVYDESAKMESELVRQAADRYIMSFEEMEITKNV